MFCIKIEDVCIRISMLDQEFYIFREDSEGDFDVLAIANSMGDVKHWVVSILLSKVEQC